MQELPKSIDVESYFRLIQESADDENGWVIDSEGAIHNNFPESTIKVHKKKFDGESVISIRYEAIVKNVEIEKWIRVAQIDYRKKWDPYMKHMEQTLEGDGTKTAYIQIKMPFPLTDRDLVQKSFSFINKKNPELVAKYNLPVKESTYYINIVEPLVIDKFPVRNDHVRGESKVITFIEELSEEKGIKIRCLNRTDIKGSIPTSLLNRLAGSGPYKSLGKQIEAPFNNGTREILPSRPQQAGRAGGQEHAVLR